METATGQAVMAGFIGEGSIHIGKTWQQQKHVTLTISDGEILVPRHWRQGRLGDGEIARNLVLELGQRTFDCS